ncbi:sporulation initiation phosphotransferase B [Bacillus sp. DTU_2020_1000418_1_SI_GHA_SEK_038]|uniref:sporulation initiation phosphotransferase B n=1 Tax=Bacillus sp. DTU_2020_1000418_1_SI_GHA_SEK_038 TaxID=3077585 RepID=UPI0028F1480C|nr:sporulation initiation phosphotransferase B [Bacillus sp. DTU_2020_1000418_1_SI_GHA_SEK_038]WNS74446.1 sporulation initiation phosphotransferase B [Bacillus sp. DTU_2020_1000418_1_SI_GHA_SEK_038]
MKTDWDVIEVLRFARHDWLNKIQLIKGNLALNKIDRAKEIINEIVVDAQAEAKLSNLNIPQFASLLLTYNWENHSFQIEYDVMESSVSGFLDDDWLTNWTSSFFKHLNSAIKPFNENHLSVTIDPQIDGTRFFFDFRGIILNKIQLVQFLETKGSAFPEIVIQSWTEQELSFDFFVSPSK